jgi:hypothetical protein
MNGRILILGAAFVGLVAGCGTQTAATPPQAPQHVTATAPATAIATPVPTAAPTAVATPIPAAPAAVGGAGDTAANPDLNYICAAAGSLTPGGNVVVYLTAAGSDTAAGKEGCAAAEAGGYFTAATKGVPADSWLNGTPTCYLTSNGLDTIRLYTADDGTSAFSVELCNVLLQDAGLAPIS